MEKITWSELQVLQQLQYKTSHLERLLTQEKVNLEDGFHQHLLSIAAPTAIAFDRVMREHQGNPTGIEFKLETRDYWAFVLPDASEPGMHRIQYFDESGFVSHFACESLFDAVQTMVREGHVIEDKGALDRLSVTDSWRRGTEVAGLLMKLNRGLIDWNQFIDARAAIA